MTYREDGKTRCKACQREVALLVEATIDRARRISRHLFQDEIHLNEVGAPVKLTDGFCPGSWESR